jgi:hypothetical protein
MDTEQRAAIAEMIGVIIIGGIGAGIWVLITML